MKIEVLNYDRYLIRTAIVFEHNASLTEIILPKNTRRKLIKAFASLENKQVELPYKKHGNIPL